MNYHLASVEFHRYTVVKLLEWIEARGIQSPDEVPAWYVGEYIADIS